MSKPQPVASLTPQQARAIDTRAVSVALSAGAGCGKTYVLTRRFLSHVDPEFRLPGVHSAEPPAELDQLIAITFTERAAREMRERIRRETLSRLQSADEAQAGHWLDLLRGLDAARISTFHSFCGLLLRRHAVEARIDPGFRILEQTAAQTLLDEALDDTLRTALSERDPDAMALALEFGLEGLKSRVSELYGELRGHDEQEWTRYSPEQLAGVWKSLYKTHFTPQLKARAENLPELQTLRVFLTNLVDVEKAADTRRHDILAALADLPTARDPYIALATLRDTAMIKGLTKKHFADEIQYARFRDTCAAARKALDDIAAFAVYDDTAALPAATLGLHALRLAARIGAAYDQRKSDENGLDFTDLQLRARDLLVDPINRDLVARLSDELRLLLVDECQDTDPVQVEILRALSGDGNKLFVVGDYKQSIYRFRGADPSVFLRLRQETPVEGRLPLSRNFRSQPGVLRFVNALFCESLSTADEPYEPLQAARPSSGVAANVEFLWPQADPAKGATQANRRLEAQWIARRLHAILSGGEPIVQDPREGPRPAHPGDIAILFRALSDVQLYEEALRDCGIPYYLVGGHAFYAQQEIFDLVNLLRAVQSPADEISLAGALRSPIFGLTDESLFRLMREGKTLAAGLTNRETWRGFVAESQVGTVERAAKTIERLRAIKDRVSIAELIRSALEWTGYDAALVAEFLGERKLANLEKLIDMARVFDRSGTLGLGDFLIQLSDYVSAEPKESLAATHPENSRVVKLMTIHKSKGLEFPIVVVPDLARPRRGGGPSAGFDPLWGPLVRPAEDPANSALAGMDFRNEMHSWDDESESTRLFYVAVTRPADHLILAAAIPDLESPPGQWLCLLAERFDLRTGKLIARLPAGYEAPAIHATTIEPNAPTDVVATKRTAWGESLTKLRGLAAAPASSRASEPAAGRLSPDPAARRRFSFSRLAVELIARPTADEFAGGDEALGRREAGKHPAGRSTTTERDPFELGTLVHAVLARLTPDRCRALRPKQLHAWIEHAAETLEIDDDELIEESRAMLQVFLDSRRFTALKNAQEFRTEVEFVLPWTPPNSTAPKTRKPKAANLADELCHLQGYVDLLYRDADDRWWIVDYKTNRVPDDPQEYRALIAEYEPQLGVYALAVEQSLGVAPAGMILHLLRNGEDEILEWNPVRRAATEAWLDARLTAARNS